MPLQHHFMRIFMAEPIFQRVGRIISATLEDAVDKLESAGSGSILRETLREVDRGIAQLQAEHDDAQARCAQLARQQEQLREEAAQLTDKARFALGEGVRIWPRRRSPGRWIWKRRLKR
jgi:phage shock protein A